MGDSVTKETLLFSFVHIGLPDERYRCRMPIHYLSPLAIDANLSQSGPIKPFSTVLSPFEPPNVQNPVEKSGIWPEC